MTFKMSSLMIALLLFTGLSAIFLGWFQGMNDEYNIPNYTESSFKTYSNYTRFVKEGEVLKNETDKFSNTAGILDIAGLLLRGVGALKMAAGSVQSGLQIMSATDKDTGFFGGSLTIIVTIVGAILLVLVAFAIIKAVVGSDL